MQGPPEGRGFRFGVALPGSEGRRDRIVEIARRAEAAGVQVLHATDHLGGWAAFSRLQVAAEATALRIGTLVLNNDLRHPTVLAQELATLDAMTDGRLEIGLGTLHIDRGEHHRAWRLGPVVDRAREEAEPRIVGRGQIERLDRRGADAPPQDPGLVAGLGLDVHPGIPGRPST